MGTLADLLRDSRFWKDTGQGLTDSVNRGAVAGLLGGPVDAVSGVVNAGLMGLGYAGNKLGLLSADRMPQPIQKPVGGSEWIGDLLQRGGMVSEQRNAPAEMLAGLLAPSAVKGASKAAFSAEESLGPKARQMAQQGIENYMTQNGLMANAVPNGPKKSFKAPQDEALRLAQQRAALPPEQGGLGLPPNNTPQQRAEAMGAVDYFHGTERLDRLLEKKTFDPKRATSGPMPFGTDERTIASRYSENKPDTSRMATDDYDSVKNYFQVSPKQLGFRGSSPYSVEQSWHFLPQEQKATILANAKRVGYENVDEASGLFKLHPEGVDASLSGSHFDYLMKTSAKGNPLTALREMWHDGGNLYNSEQELATIYKLAGYPHEISQSNAPWHKANGVFTGKALISNPLDTSNAKEIQEKVIPGLLEAFKNDRTRLKQSTSDNWAKDSRYTPKEWAKALESDFAKGENSFVWTSIPDKVTSELKAMGYNGIFDTGGKAHGPGHNVVIPFEPDQIRSKFAAFDPWRRNAAIAAAMGVAAPDLLAKEKK